MSTLIKQRRKWGTKTIAGLAACAVVALSSHAGAAASTLPPTGDSEGFAQLISSSILNTELLDVATAHAIHPDGPASEVNPLNVAALEALNLELSDGGFLQIPLIGTANVPGLLDLGQMGAVQSAGFAPTRTSATAAAGVVGADGTISLSQEDSPDNIGNATVDVTSLLDQLGLNLDGVIDQVFFRVGAVAARAEATETVVVTDYRVANLWADVDSPLVGGVVAPVRVAVDDAATDLTTALNDLVGNGSVLQDLLDVVPAISVNLPLLTSASVDLGNATIAVTPPDVSAVVNDVLGGTGAVFVSDDESVYIDLRTGAVYLDLAEIVNPGGNGLNGLAPNTDVLTAATITKITNGVGNALGKVAAAFTSATLTALESAAVEISVPLTVSGTLLGVPLVNTTGTVSIFGTLAEVLGGTATTNVSFTGALGDLLNPLLSAVTDAVLNPLLVALSPAVQTILAESGTALTATINGITTPVVQALNPLLSGVLNNIARITINDQPTIDSPARAADLGAGSYTVRAISATLLPNDSDSLVSVSLANATAFASPAASGIDDVVITSPLDGAVITTDQDSTDVPVTGTGEPGATVTVTTGTTTATTTVDGDGNWNTTLPALAPGDHTITATQTVDGTTSTDQTTITIAKQTAGIDDVVIVTPTEGSEVVADGDTADVAVTGTGEPGATVTVTSGGSTGTATVNPDGTWFTILPGLVPGAHTITATQTVGDDTSTDTVGITVVKDAAEVEDVAIVTPTDGSEVTTEDDTADVPVTGTGEPGATVTVTTGSTTVTTTVGDDGTWTATLPDLTPGDHTITATQTVGDATSTDDVTITVVMETAGVTDVTITSPADGSDIPAEDGTADVPVTGTGEPGATVTVTTGSTTVTTTVGDDGTWTATLPDLTPGDHTITATQTVDGTTSTDTVNITVVKETTGIEDVVITTPTEGSDVPTDKDSTDVPVTGTGEPGATVTVTTGDTTVTTTVNPDGTWTVTLPGLTPGAHTITATQTVDGTTSTDTVSFTIVGGKSPAPTPPGKTPPPVKPRPSLPNTGGDSDLALPGLAALLLGAVCMGLGTRRKETPRRAA